MVVYLLDHNFIYSSSFLRHDDVKGAHGEVLVREKIKNWPSIEFNERDKTATQE